mmetsp:Transcript_85735/g.239704  ORF Transcript_85735/g.239704 Transcript_85735/m.239704 type:complete len:823 (+) Transcript_85735:105-2573(+)
MGAGLSFSDEATQGEEPSPAPPQVNARYLHWLLSDPARVQEAFRPVWRACSSDEQGVVPKGTVLEVMLRVIGEFETRDKPSTDGSSSTVSGISGDNAHVSKTARQLKQVVEMQADVLSRDEALHLFRMALLSVQAAIAVNSATASMDHPRSPASYSDSSPVVRDQALSDGTPTPVSLAPRTLPCQGVRLEDTSVTPAPQPCAAGTSGVGTPGGVGPLWRAHPALAAAPSSLSGGALPSRQELEVENEQLRSLADIIEAAARDELTLVRTLEDEVRMEGKASSIGRKGTSGGGIGDSAIVSALETKIEIAEEEVARLETQVHSKDSLLVDQEAEVSARQIQISTLVCERSEEEASAEEFGREARDLALEMKNCRRQCGSLESEIASEEARATALREAFEGRRARFTTAETAARNAELSTMRATRRRIAAEASARREASAVEEAQQSRDVFAGHSAARIKALTSEVAAVRLREHRAQYMLGQGSAGGISMTPTHNAAMAEASLQAIRAELTQAEVERDMEVVLANDAAMEVQALEVSRARVQGQLASREGELRSAQRRTGRTDAGLAGGAPGAADGDEAKILRVTAELHQVEARTAAIRQHEATLQMELRASSSGMAAARGGHDMVAEEELSAEDAWREARELGAELGEARAALVRRRAEETSGIGDSVVAALRLALHDAQLRESESRQELEALQNQVVSGLVERQELQSRVSAHDTSAARGVRSLSDKLPVWSVHRDAQFADVSERRVPNLVDEFRALGRSLDPGVAQNGLMAHHSQWTPSSSAQLGAQLPPYPSGAASTLRGLGDLPPTSSWNQSQGFWARP